VPLRAAAEAPATLPLDDRIRIVGTAPFDGIAGYLRHLPAMLRTNAPILRRAIREADLLWLKVPASNAGLAAALAVRAGVPRFVWVAGSARDVARGRRLGAGAQAVGLAYDVVGRIAAGRHRIIVGRGIVAGGGIVTSLVEPEEIRDTAEAPWPAIPWRLRLAWAGRLAPGKGLELLLDALAIVMAEEPEGHRTELVVIGDGPARGALEARAANLGIADRIHWLGYVADRATYMDGLASCDLFVFPSPAEGFPKVVLDALSAGLPVLATPSGELKAMVDVALVRPIRPNDAGSVARALRTRLADPPSFDERRAAVEFAASHTRPVELERLVSMWRSRWPGLAWPDVVR
jgi:glycosyltransferase involved in cell wall biosynthesis